MFAVRYIYIVNCIITKQLQLIYKNVLVLNFADLITDTTRKMYCMRGYSVTNVKIKCTIFSTNGLADKRETFLCYRQKKCLRDIIQRQSNISVADQLL